MKAAADRRRVFTIGQWAPGLRTMLNSSIAPCGCLVGVYQGWAGQTVAVVDLPSPRCATRHSAGDVADVASVAASTAERH